MMHHDPTNEVLAMVKAKLGDAATVVEAGAHFGSDTVRMAEMFPEGRIHAFEPVSFLHQVLEAQTRHFPNVRTHQLALAAHDGPAEFHVSEGNAGASSSLLNPNGHLAFHPSIKFTETMVVNCSTLDGWAAREGVEKVDFAWLDMQGSEHSVLEASPKIFSTIKVLYTEVSLMEMYEGAPLYGNYRKWLESHGFEVVLEDLRWKDMGNVLLAKK